MNSNIYEFNAARVLGEYTNFLEGNPNCSVLAVSSLPIADIQADAKDAIAKSAERLGYGLRSIAWLGLASSNGNADTLSPEALREIVEGMDPIAIICLDGKGAEILSRSFGATLRMNSLGVVLGRRVLTFQNFTGMLENPDAKQRAWALLKELAR